MAVISFLSQKGGAGKSTLARGTAVEFTKNGWSTHVADMDENQQSTFKWSRRRSDAELEPGIEVAVYASPKTALKAQGMCDLLLVDGKPYASAHTLELAQASDLIVIPSGTTLDDLEPALNLAQELSMKGIDRKRIVILVMKAPTPKEARTSQESIRAWCFETSDSYMEFKASFGTAMDEGRSMTETLYETVSAQGDSMIQFICDKFSEVAQ